MTPQESKCESEFQFSIDDEPDAISPRYKGLLHLFECRYDPETQFWFGVAEVNCSYADVTEIQGRGRLTDFSVTVFLSDGRVGAGRLLNRHYVEDQMSRHAKMALIGWTALSLPGERT